MPRGPSQEDDDDEAGDEEDAEFVGEFETCSLFVAIVVVQLVC